jgi:NAD(P)-dependent dehydrogenase (short-subunit alcohol dehydrogenase family)
MRFSGKTVVITGAASGIGAETARLFASEGATVFAADIDAAGGDALVVEGVGDIRFQQCDVCSTDSIKALMDRAAAETGGIDVVFNNAGAGGARAKIHEIEPADWDMTMDLLLRSVAFGIRYAVPHCRTAPAPRSSTPPASRRRDRAIRRPPMPWPSAAYCT